MSGAVAAVIGIVVLFAIGLWGWGDAYDLGVRHGVQRAALALAGPPIGGRAVEQRGSRGAGGWRLDPLRRQRKQARRRAHRRQRRAHRRGGR